MIQKSNMLLASILMIGMSTIVLSEDTIPPIAKQETVFPAAHSIQFINWYFGNGKELDNLAYGPPASFSTVKFENVSFDKLGNTFYSLAVGLGYNPSERLVLNPNYLFGVLSREFNLSFFKAEWAKKFFIKLEGNGGLAFSGAGFSYVVNTAFLAGVGYAFTFTYNIAGYPSFAYVAPSLLYRQNAHSIIFDPEVGKIAPEVQFNVAWGFPLGKWGLIQGYLAFFSTQNPHIGNKQKFILISEPAFWINITKRFQIGTSLQINKNLYTPDFKVSGSIALKYNLF